MAPPPAPPDDGNFLAATGWRAGLPLAGAALGSLAGPLGTIAGGALGGFAGELLGQNAEGREETGWVEALGQGALNAVPMTGGIKIAGKVVPWLVGAGLKGGASGGAGQVMTEFGGHYDTPDTTFGDRVQRVAAATGLGTVMGAGGAQVLQRLGLGGDDIPRIARTGEDTFDSSADAAARAAGNQFAETRTVRNGKRVLVSGGVAPGRPGLSNVPRDLSPLPAHSSTRSVMQPTGAPGEFEAVEDPLAGLINIPGLLTDDITSPAAQAVSRGVDAPGATAAERGRFAFGDRAGSATANRQANQVAAGMEGHRAANPPEVPLGPFNQGVLPHEPTSGMAGLSRSRGIAPDPPEGLDALDDGLLPLGPNKQGAIPHEPTSGMAGLSRSRGAAPAEPEGLEALDDILGPLSPQRQGAIPHEPTAGMGGLSRSGGRGGVFRPDDPPTALEFGPAAHEPTSGMAGSSRSAAPAPASPWTTVGPNGPMELDVRGGGDDSIDDLLRTLGVTDDALADAAPRAASEAAGGAVQIVRGPGTISAVLPDGTVVGSANFIDNGAAGVQLANIDVDEAMQRQGIGTRLLEELRQVAGDRPLDRGEAVTDAGRAFREATPAPQDPTAGLPPELQALMGDVAPEMLRYVPREQFQAATTVAQRQAEAGHGPMETLLDMVGRWQREPNARRLMGTERKATREARERVGRWMERPGTGGERAPIPRPLAGDAPLDGGEGGFADPELMARLAGAGVGGVAGSAAGAAMSDEDTKGRNALGFGVLGALTGAGGGRALSAFQRTGSMDEALRDTLEGIQRWRYGSMLSGAAQASNIVGGVGAAHLRMLEEVLQGNVGKAGKMAGALYSPQTVRRGVQAFKENLPDVDATDAMPTRWGHTEGALGYPSRVLHSVDEAFTDALERGGLDLDEAKDVLFTNRPHSRAGQWTADRGALMQTIMPFVKTASNLVERGLEHTPGVGHLPAVRGMRDASHGQALARQGLGLAAVGAGASGMLPEDEGGSATRRTVEAALGPLLLPAQAGEAIAGRLSKGQDPARGALTALIDTIREMSPLPGDSYDYDPARFLASFVPSGLSLMAPKAASEFDTTETLFDPAIAKIPGLQGMLDKKPARRTRRRTLPADRRRER